MKFLKKLLVVPLVLFGLQTEAAQHITNADKSIAQVVVSNRDVNALIVDGRRIQNFIPSNDNAFEIQKDVVQGSIYFKVNPEYSNTSTSAFVTDEEGARYKLVLQPRSVTSEEVILVPSEQQNNKKRSAQSYQHQIKELMYVMADNADSNSNNLAVDGIVKSTINAEIPLWKEVSFNLLNRFDSDGMYGELYQLKNVTNKSLNLLEQEFYRKGVVAVSVENLSLQPNKTTFVYVVREQ